MLQLQLAAATGTEAYGICTGAETAFGVLSTSMCRLLRLTPILQQHPVYVCSTRDNQTAAGLGPGSWHVSQHARSRMLTLCPVWPLLLQEPPLRFPAWPFGGGGVPAAACF
jgi:hypothetical protein